MSSKPKHIIEAEKLAAMVNNGMSQQDIAKSIGASQATVSRIISNLLVRVYVPRRDNRAR